MKTIVVGIYILFVLIIAKGIDNYITGKYLN
jgi:hypothetical protein